MALDLEIREKLEGQARMLAIGHYVVGALIMLFSLLPLIYVAFGFVFVLAPIPTNPNEPSPVIVGVIIIAVGLLATAFILATGILNLIAGMGLSSQKWKVTIFVAAVVNLMNQPLGLILGILTILYMIQGDVSTLFDEAREEREGDLLT